MATPFKVNDQGQKTPATVELSDEYKLMIDEMLEKEEKGEAEYVSIETIKNRFAFP